MWKSPFCNADSVSRSDYPEVGRPERFSVYDTWFSLPTPIRGDTYTLHPNCCLKASNEWRVVTGTEETSSDAWRVALRICPGVIEWKFVRGWMSMKMQTEIMTRHGTIVQSLYNWRSPSQCSPQWRARHDKSPKIKGRLPQSVDFRLIMTEEQCIRL